MLRELQPISIIDTQGNNLGRYGMLAVTYKLQNFGQKSVLTNRVTNISALNRDISKRDCD